MANKIDCISLEIDQNEGNKNMVIINDPKCMELLNILSDDNSIRSNDVHLFAVNTHCDLHRKKDNGGLQQESEEQSQNYTDPLAFKICDCCGEPTDTAHLSGDYKCEQCDKLFTMETSLELHKRNVHNKNIFQCMECDCICPDYENLIKHQKIHERITCDKCCRTFSRKYHLERHLQQKTCNGTPKTMYTCQVCGHTFARKDNLTQHLRSHVSQVLRKKDHTCEQCGKVFQGSALLKIHERSHTGERPYPCEMCPKKFPSSGALRKHIRKHTGERPYECSQCKKRFAAKETLNRHVRTHTGVKPYACEYCGKTFIQCMQLRAHIFHHTGENGFECEYCGKKFNRKIRLETHVKYIHEGAKPLECPECKKTFMRKEDLARHSVLHSGVKEFQCDICSKQFALKSSLKIHKLTHRREQPRSCYECGRAFIREDCLLRHMRTKHRETLEKILAETEKKRLQKHLGSVVIATTNPVQEVKSEDEDMISDPEQNTDEKFIQSVREFMTILMDEETLKDFGWPNAPIEDILDSVLKKCGHIPIKNDEFDFVNRLRENTKLLFSSVIDNDVIKSLLNNKTVDEVTLHVLKLAKA